MRVPTLGTGDCGFDFLLTELLHEPPQNRHSPKTGDDGLGDGNHLAFAAANRWIDELTYVIGGRYEDFMDYPWPPGDLLPHLFEDFDLETRTIRLPTLEPRDLRESLPALVERHRLSDRVTGSSTNTRIWRIAGQRHAPITPPGPPRFHDRTWCPRWRSRS